MTDRDLAQMNALKAIYPGSQVLLCIWHVLRAFRSHFVTEEFQALWAKAKCLVKTEDLDEFNKIWAEIKSDPLVPRTLICYLDKDWMPLKEKWSLVYRTERSLIEEGDTNMLIEALVILSSL